MSRWQLVVSTFVELADTLGDDFDVQDFLQNLVDRAVEITGAAACGLILADQRGRLRLVASTDHDSRVLELFAIATEQGPCQDCFRSGEPVVNVDPDKAQERWPAFTDAAHAVGMGATHVVPMRLRTQILGAMSLFFRTPDRLEDDDLAVALALASVATIGLLQERTPRQRELLAEQMQSVIDLQVVIEQAKGVVAERAGVDVDTAFTLLRDSARRTRTSVGRVATDVVEGRPGVGGVVGSEAPDPH